MEFNDLISAVQAAESPTELWHLLLDYCDGRGVARLSYHHHGRVEGFGENAAEEPDTATYSVSETLHIVAHGFPREWVDDYVEQRLYLVDPIPELAQRVTDPFFWSDTEQLAHTVGLQSEYLQRLAESDVGEGLAIQVFGPGMRDGYFGLGFGEQRPDLTPEQIREIQCALQAIHLRYCSMVLERMEQSAALSPREREVLEWIAKGKSNSVIADILGLSAHTIDTMVRRIFAKLGVNDRTTAAIKGVGSGLVLPESISPA